jgi:hypothetical protein
MNSSLLLISILDHVPFLSAVFLGEWKTSFRMEESHATSTLVSLLVIHSGIEILYHRWVLLSTLVSASTLDFGQEGTLYFVWNCLLFHAFHFFLYFFIPISQ